MITKIPLLTILLSLILFNFSWAQQPNPITIETVNDSLNPATISPPSPPPPPQFTKLIISYDLAGNQIQRFYCDEDCYFGRSAETITFEEETVSSHENLTIYPNPTKDNVTIRINSDDNSKLITSIYVYSVNGSLIQKITEKNGINNREINLVHLKTGLYILHIHFNDNTTSTKKIIKE